MTYWLYVPTLERRREESSSRLLRVPKDQRGLFSRNDAVFVYHEGVIDCIYYKLIECQWGFIVSIDAVLSPVIRMALRDNFNIERVLLKIERDPEQYGLRIPNHSGDWLLDMCYGQPNHLSVAPLWSPEVESSPIQETEALRFRMERLTQGVFRDRLLAFWSGACCVSGVSIPVFLRASHIKPWAIATGAERMDPNNGLLLAVNYDLAFDQGLITFEDDGVMTVHAMADVDALAITGVVSGSRILRPLNAPQRTYMAYHRENVFGAWLGSSKP